MLFSEVQWSKFVRSKLNLEENVEIQNDRRGFLSVIADTAEVSVYIIRKEMLALLPKKLKKEVLRRIALLDEKDRPLSRKDLQIRRADNLKWDKYKEKVATEIISHKNIVKKQ